jgi:hypothetical protein
MKLRQLSALAACLALLATAQTTTTAIADTLSAEAAAKSLFNGVWAPEHHPPGGPGGPGGAPRRGPPPGAGFGPPPGPGFGPPPGGPGGMRISAEDQAKGLDPGDLRTRAMMTDEGRAKFATFDPLEHPTSNCKTPGLPAIAMIPELQEWKVSPTVLEIRHESDAVVRTIHLDGRAHPTEAHTVLGHAVGSFSGQQLTIETANLNAEWGGLGRNAPGSEARIVRETYRLVDKDTIEGEITLSDTRYLKQDLHLPVVLKRQPAGTQIVDFPCDEEVAKRDYQYMKQQ